MAYHYPCFVFIVWTLFLESLFILMKALVYESAVGMKSAASAFLVLSTLCGNLDLLLVTDNIANCELLSKKSVGSWGFHNQSNWLPWASKLLTLLISVRLYSLFLISGYVCSQHIRTNVRTIMPPINPCWRVPGLMPWEICFHSRLLKLMVDYYLVAHRITSSTWQTLSWVCW